MKRASIMTCFGCNFEGPIPPERVVERLREILDVAAEEGCEISILNIADTMG